MKFYGVVKWFVSRLFPFVCKFETSGFDELIKGNKGYIICCNHVSLLDPIAVLVKVKDVVHFLGKSELFKSAFSTYIFKKMQVIPVTRGRSNPAAIQTAISVVNSGGVLGVFPEGTRSRTGELGMPRSGAAFIAFVTKADILPIGVTYERRKFRRPRIILRCGQMIKYEDLMMQDESRVELKRVSKLIMAKIEELIK
ncbi:MAG: 1-acyl-sn-glycerol-3-phosphate acyltransferase [Oscillospiraceae bacterium]|jgi:1-acyl-sn-glycerol-3-phosphate acyltransferase|nr:1-acyl-sn-glycerol-3-phosphate acyltransferase [Oscillospiraceae bacterium]